jgi:hypothetical protein
VCVIEVGIKYLFVYILTPFAIQVQVAKDKLDAARLEELTDNEETIAELKRRHEREKLLLLEDNKKLMMDLDTVSVTSLHTTLLFSF